MSALTETAFAKLNLALHVRERMADGYHRIETIFAFCEHGDELSAAGSGHLSLDIEGPMGGSVSAGADNLVMKAAKLLQQERAATIPALGDGGADITLTKRLPVGGGVGGGSADAAATLRLLNRLWCMSLQIEKLEELAVQLGADVPACLYSVPMRGHGRGDELTPVGLGLSGTPVLLVNPRAELSTAEVFGGWDGVDRGPLTDWRDGRNDLEQPAIAKAPLIGAVLAWLSVQSGAQHVRMSGSGATCFALFDSEALRDKAAIAVPREWWRLATRLR